jgi:hypothetical protein
MSSRGRLLRGREKTGGETGRRAGRSPTSSTSTTRQSPTRPRPRHGPLLRPRGMHVGAAASAGRPWLPGWPRKGRRGGCHVVAVPVPPCRPSCFFLVCVCARARWGPCEYNELMPAIKPSPWMGLQRQPNTRTNADGWTGRGQCATAQQVGPVSPR